MEQTKRAISTTLCISRNIYVTYAPRSAAFYHTLRHPRQYKVLATLYRRFSNIQQRTKPTTAIQQPPSFLNCHRNFSSGVINITTNDESEKLTIQWPASNGDTIDYSYVWLRDSCLCPKCHEPSAKSRLLMMKDLVVNLKPKDIKVESGIIQITWDDSHVSRFPVDWLKERGFSAKNLQERNKSWPLSAKSWGEKFTDYIPRESFHNLMTNDRSLYDWICTLEKLGFFIITDTPCESGSIEKFAERIAFLRVTNYSKYFSVKVKTNPSSSAFTSAALGLHTDLPYYYHTPGVQMLHCINQVSTKGGENQFADGFYVAEIVKKLRPDYYKILCTSLVEYYDIGTDYYKFHKLTHKPVIQLDVMGNTTQINYSNQARDYYAHLPADELTALFKAMKFFDDILHNPDNHIKIKLQEGEVACFNNYRIMHGRESYEAIGGGERHYEGGYLDWDELHSKRRVLQEELRL